VGGVALSATAAVTLLGPVGVDDNVFLIRVKSLMGKESPAAACWQLLLDLELNDIYDVNVII